MKKEDPIHLSKENVQRNHDRPRPGRLFVVGIGPGGVIQLVPLPRFERGACGLGIRRSILLSYRGDTVGNRTYLTRFSASVNTGQA